ncbi:S1C family serine protease [Phormidesmis priestleyi]
MIQTEIVALADRLRRSTVQIRSRKSGAGSGVIWRSDGLIVTNAHVVRGRETEVELSDGRVLPAQTIAHSVQRDLAALQIDAVNFPVVEVGDSDRLRVGEFVLAVGNPLGRVGALTTGIIHTAPGSWIQADISLAPGNSGGALANAQGQVIGINTMIVHDRGFAIPSNVVQWFLNNHADRPYLGVTLESVRVRLGRKPAYGLLITQIEADSPAEVAHLLPGDILIGVRGTAFQTANELFHILERSHSGDGLPLEILRGGIPKTVEVVLYGRSTDEAAAA